MDDRQAIEAEIEQLEREVLEAKKRVNAARKRLPPEPVRDYTFALPGGGHATLAELFGDKSDLLVVHNMGECCAYCTLWADGFNGLVPELESRAAFVVVSPDSAEEQADFAARRGWRFRMASAKDSPFTLDMGYLRDGHRWPGISAFRKQADGSVVRVSHCFLGPGDDFCAVWHLYDLLADGANGWEPAYRV